jgi:hypothetical protein
MRFMSMILFDLLAEAGSALLDSRVGPRVGQLVSQLAGPRTRPSSAMSAS